ncbi:phosphomannomutase/phosphoglucomutase [Aquisalimonas sp.]|uniref:phosphomannomutase/phosphoglucomutase n=1 Tax=Aquisalimonas sp. TaxID=1872621 RepID=UPI0025C33B42|nr:phosphomannomutase/phosphoglucomutase [Aquisalimonas sp.]
MATTDTDKENGVHVDRNLFRAYDIRGVVGDSLSADVVREIGRSIGSEAAARGCTDVVVGRDGRLSSPELSQALIEGLSATGRHVIDIGQVPTPVMYFATHHLNTGTGVEITGSHNPPDYNGMKIMIGGETLSGDAIAGLYQRLLAGDLLEGKGRVQRQDVVEDYIDAIAADITLHRPLRVVLDAGNGVGGGVAPQVLRAIGCEVELLYCDVDGTFPNHHPDPSDPANLETLIDLVRLQQADVGLALDGDGDRLGVVDATGKIIWADRQMMLYARDVLSRHPGADIVFDVKCSSQLAQVISEHAGVPVMWRTGHSLIKARLKASGAPLAGEMSGHIFFNDRWPGFDDGIYTAARLLEILSMETQSSTDVFAALPEAVSTPEIKVNLKEGEPPEVIARLVAAAEFPDAQVTTIDGLRVDFPDGWGLVRASNTTPCLVLRFEGDDAEALERIRARFRELLLQARPGLELPF